ncbi:hypothetical protein B7463_g4698, partial [Scytalidium lignicola]
MFLHSGAAIHRHEYSPPLELRAPASRLRRSTLSRVSYPTTNVPRRSASFDAPTPMPILQPLGRALAEYVQPTNEQSVRFQEPDLEAMSEDGKSVANSETSVTTSVTTTGGPRPRKRTRNSTSFSLAHPAPTLGQKQKLIIVRPRLLLQLQRLSPDSRPKPAIDVLPSTVVVPRLVKRFPRLFTAKGGLGANDVMIVKSEEYGTPDIKETEDTDSDDDRYGAREVLAVICQMRKDEGGTQGVAEIVLADGTVWTARPMTNGLYEFTCIDHHGIKTTARWVKRTSQRASLDFATTKGSNLNVRFTFSIIDPNSRRHPIMATITQKKLDIPDYYTSVSPSSGKHPPPSPLRTFPGDSEYLDHEPSPDRATHYIDPKLRNLITVTGIWVALRQGWSPYFKYDDAMSVNAEPANGKGHNRRRSSSLTPESGRLSPALTQSTTSVCTQSAFRRRSYGRDVSRSQSFNAPSLIESSPKRTTSTGAVFMERLSARRAGHASSTATSESDAEIAAPAGSKGIDESIVTTRLTTIPSHRHSLPPSLTFPLEHPETPSRPPRRVASYIAPNSLAKGLGNEAMDKENIPPVSNGQQIASQPEKPKIKRWKAFTRLFRRSNKSRAT